MSLFLEILIIKKDRFESEKIDRFDTLKCIKKTLKNTQSIKASYIKIDT